MKWWLVIAAPFLGLALAEVLLRVFEKDPGLQAVDSYIVCLTTHDGRRISHDGRKVAPNQGGLELAISPYTLWKNRANLTTSAFRTNAHGLRGPEVPTSRPDRKRILVLGASAVFGVALPSDADTLPAQLQAQVPGSDVLNGGVALFQSGQEVSYFVTELVDFAPKIVVAYDGWPDAFEGVFGVERGGAAPGYNMTALLGMQELLLKGAMIEEDAATLGGLVRKLWRNSRVAAALTRAAGGRAPPGPGVDMLGGGLGVPTTGRGDLTKAVETYARNMLKLSDFCRARGMLFLVALQPEVGQKKSRRPDEARAFEAGIGGLAGYPANFSERYVGFRRAAAEKLRAAGVAVVDVGDQAEFADSNEVLFYDVVHMTPEGNRIAAAIVAKALAALERG